MLKTKHYVKVDPRTSKKLQLLAFDCGLAWYAGEQTVQLINISWLFFDMTAGHIGISSLGPNPNRLNGETQITTVDEMFDIFSHTPITVRFDIKKETSSLQGCMSAFYHMR